MYGQHEVTRVGMLVWSSGVSPQRTLGGSGKFEIPICVLRWLDMTVGHHCVAARNTVTIFGDNCAGRNKNLEMVLMVKGVALSMSGIGKILFFGVGAFIPPL